MSQLLVDAMDNAGLWRALQPDNTTPSTSLTIATDSNTVRYGADAASLLITASESASNHRLHRSFASLDLSAFDELRLWLRASRPADGSSVRPFYLELRLASVAMGLDHPDNRWHRFLPIAQPGQWGLVRLSLRDLPAAIRRAVNLLQVSCLNLASGFHCYIDDLIAVREELLGDVDRSLVATLHHRLSLDGNPVTALIVHSGVTEPALPLIRIIPCGLHLVPEGSVSVEQRSDFVAGGYSLLPATSGYALFYEIDCRAANREQSTQLFEFVLRTFSPYGQLLINNVMHRVEHINIPLDRETELEHADRLTLRFKVYTRLESGQPQPVVIPFNQLATATALQLPQ
jgi:hypothetical protein